jgi:O-antigen/teichoic acid export membrane protein
MATIETSPVPEDTTSAGNRKYFHALGRNVVLKYASELSRLFQMLYFIVAARAYGASGLGSLTVLLMAGSAIVLLFGDFGLNTLMVARVSCRAHREQEEVTSQVLWWKMVLSVLAFLLMWAVMSLTSKNASRIDICSVAIVSLGGLWLEFFGAVTNAIDRFDLEVWLRISYRGAVYGFGALAALFVGLHHNLEIMAGMSLADTIIALFVLGNLLSLKRHHEWRDVRLLRASLPIWVTQLSQLTYLKFDVVILGLLHVATRETGWYAAAWKIADVLTGVPALLAAAALPLISGGTGSIGFRTIAPKYLKAMYILPFFLTLPLSVGAEWITRLLYGRDFSGTPRVMQILVWAVAPFFIHTFLVILAVAVGRQREAACLAGATSIIGISASVLLVPRYGYESMAFVCLIANTIFAITMIYRFRNVTGSAQLSIAFMSLGSALTILLLSRIAAGWIAAPVLMLASAFGYGIGVLLLGGISVRELGRMREIMGSLAWRSTIHEVEAG